MKQEAFKLFAPEIKALLEGKQIQIFIRNKWVDTDNPSFDVESKYRVKPEEPKTILERSIDGVIWYEIGKVPTELNNKMKFARIRIIGEEKPKPTKRLPTIEEVEKWFMENRVFRLKTQIHGLYRMETISIEQKSLRIGGRSIIIDELCEDFTHYDGSELYITENEKLTYGGEIADFPVEIVERMLECQVEQGYKRDVSVFERNKRAVLYGFDWMKTKEGYYFWHEVISNKNFNIFFQKYPKKSNQ